MAFPKSHLSQHSKARIQERFRISEKELLDLLNSGQGKKIGKSARTHLAHRLLWSHVDEALLVAIQDVVDGTVLTVLTLEMYCARYEHNITDKRIVTVVNKMVHAGLAPSELWTPGDKNEYVIIYAALQDTPQHLALGAWKGPVPSSNLEELSKIQSFWIWVAVRVLASGHAVERVEAVLARFSGSELQNVPFER